jgi:hypothetical protein
MQTHHGLSTRRADSTLGLSRSARHYRARPRDDGPLIEVIESHLKDNPGHGFSLLFDQALHPKGFGKTRSWRVYVALKLNLPRRGKRRLPDRIREPLEVPMQANHTWSADFMADALWSGQVVPVGAVLGVIRGAHDKARKTLGSVSYAVEVYDSSTNRLLRAFIVYEYPMAEDVKASVGPLGSSEASIRRGASLLVSQLQ